MKSLNLSKAHKLDLDAVHYGEAEQKPDARAYKRFKMPAYSVVGYMRKSGHDTGRTLHERDRKKD